MGLEPKSLPRSPPPPTAARTNFRTNTATDVSVTPTMVGPFQIRCQTTVPSESDSLGNLVWQRLWDDAAGFEAVAVTPDGSVYAASSRLRPKSNFSQFDVIVLKLTPAGTLVWARTYGGGEVVDARGGMAAAADGSIYTAGAIQAAKGGIVGIAALVLKIGSDGTLLFGKECCTKGGDTGEGIAVAPDGSVFSPERRRCWASASRMRSSRAWSRQARR